MKYEKIFIEFLEKFVIKVRNENENEEIKLILNDNKNFDFVNDEKC